jgi:hypothetical protein
MSTLEQQLRSGGEVRLGRREAHDVLQKLRARGGHSATADRLEERLAHGADEVTLDRPEAESLLDELRASGRRWVGGAGRPAPPITVEEPEEPEEPQKGFFSRLFSGR